MMSSYRNNNLLTHSFCNGSVLILFDDSELESALRVAFKL